MTTPRVELFPGYLALVEARTKEFDRQTAILQRMAAVDGMTAPVYMADLFELLGESNTAAMPPDDFYSLVRWALIELIHRRNHATLDAAVQFNAGFDAGYVTGEDSGKSIAREALLEKLDTFLGREVAS